MINNQLFGLPMALISLALVGVVALVVARSDRESGSRRALVAGLVRARAIWSRSRINRRRAAAA